MKLERPFICCMTLGSFALLLLMPTTSFAREAHGAALKKKVRTCPIVWKEFKSLNSLNRGFIEITADENGKQNFGWFMYRLFVDPTLRLSTFLSMGVHPQMPEKVHVSEEVHEHYKHIARAYTEIPEFKRAMNLLFENGGLTNRIWFQGTGKLTALSQKDRALLQIVSQLMQSAFTRKDLDADTKAAISLIIALTTGNDFQNDAVSLQKLSQIPNSYRKQKIITLLSYYYRYLALYRRHRYAEMQTIIKEAWTDNPSFIGIGPYDEFHIQRQMQKKKK